MVVSDDEDSSVSGEGEATDSPPGPTERKGKKTLSLAQKAYLNSLFEAGLRSASKSQRPFLEKAAADYWSYDIPSSCAMRLVAS